jgi:predicted ATPase
VIYSFDHSPVKAIHYEDTEHYQIYKSFMENPGGYLQKIDQDLASDFNPVKE